MKYNNENIIKERAIDLYIKGKTLSEISKVLECSRNYIGNIIKDDKRIKNYRNTKTVKLYKWKRQSRINVSISTDFWEKIGISKKSNKDEYVDITVNEKDGIITIKKH